MCELHWHGNWSTVATQCMGTITIIGSSEMAQLPSFQLPRQKKKKHLSLINLSLGFIVPSACSLQSMFSLSDAVLEASSLACKQVIASRALGGITWALEAMEVSGRPVDFLSQRVKDGALVGV